MVFSDAGEGSDGAIRLCREIYGRSGPLLLSRPVQQPGQLESALSKHTGPEIIEQTGGAAHALRGGHGHQRHLHGRHPPLQARSAGSEVLFGAALQRLPRPGRPEAHAHRHRARHLRRNAGRRQLWIETEDAYRMVRRLAREEGLLVGISSGATCTPPPCWRASWRSAAKAATIVTVLCDSAEKYLSEHFWDEE
jgi:S-sulfo-L-cysteine synthase (O-acetyl-L-serine-dependent)